MSLRCCRLRTSRQRVLAALGNLYTELVSNFSEDARTSHPCERGAGLLR